MAFWTFLGFLHKSYTEVQVLPSLTLLCQKSRFFPRLLSGSENNKLQANTQIIKEPTCFFSERTARKEGENHALRLDLPNNI